MRLQERKLALEEEVLRAASALPPLLEKAGLSAQEINERYNLVSVDAFYESLPENVRAAYKNLHGKIHDLQDLALEEDGVSKDFFQRAPEPVPEWLVQHAAYLEKQALPPAVTDFINKKINSAGIEDEEINTLAGLCSRQWDCIQKSATLLIKANHKFSERQFKIIDQFKREG